MTNEAATTEAEITNLANAGDVESAQTLAGMLARSEGEPFDPPPGYASDYRRGYNAVSPGDVVSAGIMRDMGI